MRSSDPAELRDDLGAAGGELTRLLPDLRSHVGDLPEPVVADQDTERHRLNAAVSDLLVAAGRRRPLLLVFEDGHWADTQTPPLPHRFVAGATDARMLLVATFRDTEADVPAELSEALIDMRRSDGVVRVRVGALTGEQVSEFVERAAGAPLGPALPELAGAITSLTQGNVFLVTELWRELVETEALEIVDGVAILTRPLSALGTPESVREVVNQRLARLQPETALRRARVDERPRDQRRRRECERRRDAAPHRRVRSARGPHARRRSSGVAVAGSAPPHSVVAVVRARRPSSDAAVTRRTRRAGAAPPTRGPSGPRADFLPRLVGFLIDSVIVGAVNRVGDAVTTAASGSCSRCSCSSLTRSTSSQAGAVRRRG